jgi:hypothetical protein
MMRKHTLCTYSTGTKSIKEVWLSIRWEKYDRWWKKTLHRRVCTEILIFPLLRREIFCPLTRLNKWQENPLVCQRKRKYNWNFGKYETFPRTSYTS